MNMWIFKKKRIYLDNAASTPIDARVLQLHAKLARELIGNPNALHKDGLKAKKVLEESRKMIADVLSARPKEIIFTNSGTDSNNIAINGVINNYELRITNEKPHVITSTIEHSSVLDTCKDLEKKGIEVTYIKPESNGIISAKKIKEALKPETILVSISYANNEIGTIQPIKEIAKEIRHYNKNNNSKILLHTDAVQAMNYLPIKVDALGVDLFSFNSSKNYGPKGVGALYIKDGTKINLPIQGTPDVPSIRSFAEAIKITRDMAESESVRLTKLRDYMFEQIEKEFPKAIINGDKENRLPNNINISIPNIESEYLVLGLDAKGISVSSKSACTNEDDLDSYVIMNLRENANIKEGSVRFSLGRMTTPGDIDRTILALKHVISRANIN